MTRRHLVAFAVLAAALAVQLRIHILRSSPTIDEPIHVLAGYRHLRCGDFGINAEHPPLAKLVAALPLRFMDVRDPLGPCTQRFTPAPAAFNAGGVFLAANGIERLIVPSRIAAAAFTLVLFLVVFLFARELFGATPALLAAAVIAFEPTLLAHGSLVTTDMAVTAMFLTTLFATHRWRANPTMQRVVLVGLAAGLTLSAKHSGVLVLPVLAMLMWRNVRALLITLAVAAFVLFATYGFQLAPYFEGWRILLAGSERPTWILGREYSRGQWFYFPLVFTIKASVMTLVLAVFALRTRQRLLLLAPAALWLAAGMTSGINIGVRHILPLWPLLIIAGSAAAWELTRRKRAAQIVLGALLVFHGISALVTAPSSIAFANELWGGTRRSHALLQDSNVEWGQNTKLVAEYVQQHEVRDCWFAAYGHGSISRALQPCRLLPALGWTAGGAAVEPIPAVLRGTVFVSSTQLPPRGGREYLPIVTRTADDVLGGSVLVYRGEFRVDELARRVEQIREQQQALGTH